MNTYINKNIMRAKAAFASLMVLGLLASCGQDHDLGAQMSEAQLINSVELSESGTIKLAVGMTKQITATSSPDNATFKDLVWTSYNTDVATADNNGTLTGIAPGQATVQIRQDGNLGSLATLQINVMPVATALSMEKISLYEGTTKALAAQLTPTDAYDVLSWKIADASIATIKGDSVVGLTPGTTTITATTTDGSNLTATAELEVKKVVPVTGIALEAPGYDLNVGESSQIGCSLIPADATADLLTWTSSDESVATVNAQGVVTALKYGTTTITATSSNGVSKLIDITVGEGTINQDFTTGIGKWYLGQSGSSYQYGSNGLVVTMQSGSKWRGDFNLGSNINPVTINVGTYRYLAFKMTRPGAYVLNTNGKGTIVLDTSKGRYQQKSGNGNNRYSILNYEGNEAAAAMDEPQVIYFDLQSGFGNTPYYFAKDKTEGGLTTFKLLVADIPSTYDRTYTLYWVHAFKTLDELKAYAAKH
jgi:uncharacterized protein YjdB